MPSTSATLWTIPTLMSANLIAWLFLFQEESALEVLYLFLRLELLVLVRHLALECPPLLSSDGFQSWALWRCYLHKVFNQMLFPHLKTKNSCGVIEIPRLIQVSGADAESC